MRRLAIVDFDETIITIDSMSYIAKAERWFLKPAAFVAGIRLFVALLLGRNTLDARSKFKQELLFHYAALDDEKKANYIEYFRSRINHELINSIVSQAYDAVIILSASERELIATTLNEIMHVDLVIANELSRTPFITCWGPEKVQRLREEYPQYTDFEVDTYSDSLSDKPLFEISTHSYLITKNGHIEEL